MGGEGDANPIIKMLGWRVRRLTLDEVQKVLAALASIEDETFTLTDLIDMLPQEIKQDRNKRRSVGNLLQYLVKLGYLSKPSERKWIKNYPTLSHYLTQQLLDLSSLERTPPHSAHEEEKIVSHREKPRKSGRTFSR